MDLNLQNPCHTAAVQTLQFSLSLNSNEKEKKKKTSKPFTNL